MKEALVVSHLELITKICWKYWSRMPPSLHAYMDIEDLIGECCLLVVSRQHRYKQCRGASGAFVQRIVQNHCLTLLTSHHLKKRRVRAFIYFSEPELANILPSYSDEGVRWLLAKEPMEQIIRDASDNLRRHFSDFLHTRNFRRFTKQDIAELQKLARHHHLSPSDLILVLVEC